MKRSTAALMATLLCAAAPAQDFALQRLEASPRHHEWVDVPASGGRIVRTFVAYPEVSGEATTLVVIHENKGLTDWVRSVADQLAEHGYLAVAPDLLSGTGPGGGGTEAFESADAATQGIYALDQAQVTSDLQAVADYAAGLPAGSGKVAVAGFCWGGGQVLRFATNRPDLAAAFVFYGMAELSAEEIARIPCTVVGFYGENDARINASLPALEDQMRQAGKLYIPLMYPDAGHGFMRSGEDPAGSAADQDARTRAWERWLEELAKID